MTEAREAAITPEARAAFKTRFCRHLAIAAIQALAHRGLSIEEVATTVGKRPQEVRRGLMRLIDGKSIQMDDISDFITACLCELTFTIHDVQARPLPTQPERGGDE
jgi:hypothetical protein